MILLLRTSGEYDAHMRLLSDNIFQDFLSDFRKYKTERIIANYDERFCV